MTNQTTPAPEGQAMTKERREYLNSLITHLSHEESDEVLGEVNRLAAENERLIRFIDSLSPSVRNAIGKM